MQSRFSRTIAGIAAILVVFCGTARAEEVPTAPEMFTTEESKALADQFHASPLIKVGPYIYLSGVTAFLENWDAASEEELEDAIRQAYADVLTALEPAGLTKKNIVDITTYHVGMRRNQDIVAKVHAELFDRAPYPAWTAIGVEKLWLDSLFLEIKVVAADF